MDLNLEFSAHQKALMSAHNAGCETDRETFLAEASLIALRISHFQRRLGAAAACAISAACSTPPAKQRT